MRRAVFLDRDGTLMEEVHYCNDPAMVRAMPGAAEVLGELRSAGWLNIIVTNQSGIASGRIALEEYEAVQAELLRQLAGRIDAVYFCADDPSRPTVRRKPGIGMLMEAAAEYGLDLGACWMVGDRDVDVGCGRAAGCRTVLVRTGYGRDHTESGADFEAADVVSAARIVLSHS
jgi:D-glycero-D-manno-heptose 1,7-bisphosphate phosphatase